VPVESKQKSYASNASRCWTLAPKLTYVARSPSLDHFIRITSAVSKDYNGLLAVGIVHYTCNSAPNTV
jgi:hypothetical protein